MNKYGTLNIDAQEDQGYCNLFAHNAIVYECVRVERVCVRVGVCMYGCYFDWAW